MYPHKQLLERNDINPATLPDDIRAAIEKFDTLELDLEEASDEDDDREEVKISNELRTLSKELAKEIREHLDEETEEELSPSQVKERILTAIVKDNRLHVTKAELVQEGYPGAGNISLSFREVVGPYVLVKKMGDSKLFIEKR